MLSEPLVTIAVPSYNQGQFLDQALSSIFQQNVAVEVYLVDGGSTDSTLEIIEKWAHRLAGWRSYKDSGQAAAINEAIAQGKAPYVSWLNSDDALLSSGLSYLLNELHRYKHAPMVYGRAWNVVQNSGRHYPVWVQPFSEWRLARRCIISQPATLIRRAAWEQLGGVNDKLHMAMDYDLWWRLFKLFGAPQFVDKYIAINRIHANTKTKTQRARHYHEAIDVVRDHYGSVPLKWWLIQPYAVWFKSIWP